MSMTFLQLAQRLRQEVGAPGAGPAAVTNQTGESRRIVDWTIFCWKLIQNKHSNWLWMRHPFTLNTVADDDTYAYADATDTDAGTVIARFKHWWWQDHRFPLRIYLQSAGVGTEQYLTPIEYNAFRNLYKKGTQVSSFPIHCTVDPQRNLLLGPKPNGVYVVSGDFQRSAQVLAANSDTPEMPGDYHDLIYFEAMKHYAGFDAANEVFARGNLYAAELMGQLEANQLPRMGSRGPLV